MTTALYLGRFQPFHKGHLSMLEYMFRRYDKIVIAICSATEECTKRNPFNYIHRYNMVYGVISNKFSSEYKRFKIIPIPDIKCPEKWADFTHSIFGEYDVVFTNNKNTKKLFEDRGDKVVGTKPYTIDRVCYTPKIGEWTETYEVRGTLIRECIAHKESFWEELVPNIVANYIKTRNLHIQVEEIYNEEIQVYNYVLY